MGKAAEHIGNTPREVSFKAAQETLVSFHQTLLGESGDWLEEKIANMLEIIGQHVVGNRPGRSEPRAVKKRPKPHKRLQHPRSQAHINQSVIQVDKLHLFDTVHVKITQFRVSDNDSQ
ncbi:hypothetical protein NX722_15135 [Endozoicomonas gorgoniicola]|uniref:Mutator family transposase n=1 Tax=Endozoicomonas gorgoniicola TaxID=1234144 RepID=A0ABT3MX25_9GAMM|nr:hypothetical protein [Endozoicomonas gorgoniicola]MCW7553932.1 hypothetical protein [Endozoicomonas gorgoniicola]